MRDPDLDSGFSWPLAFFITGISFLAFFYTLGKFNEHCPRIFLWTGIASLVLAIGSGLGSLSRKLRNNSHHQQIDQ